jgi:hypothetical protein
MGFFDWIKRLLNPSSDQKPPEKRKITPKDRDITFGEWKDAVTAEDAIKVIQKKAKINPKKDKEIQEPINPVTVHYGTEEEPWKNPNFKVVYEPKTISDDEKAGKKPSPSKKIGVAYYGTCASCHKKLNVLEKTSCPYCHKTLCNVHYPKENHDCPSRDRAIQ